MLVLTGFLFTACERGATGTNQPDGTTAHPPEVSTQVAQPEADTLMHHDTSGSARSSLRTAGPREFPNLPSGCKRREVEDLIAGFFRAVNHGETERISDFFSIAAGPEGMSPRGWYSLTEGDPKAGGRHFAAYTDRDLRTYFERRSRQHERLRLLTVNISAPTWYGGVDITYVVSRLADDLERSPEGSERQARGKGAINCERGRIFVWSMAHQ